MPGLLDSLRKRLCCPRPPRVTGVVAATGGGSGEVFVAWDPLPAGVAAYRVYRRTSPGVWRPLATVTPTAFDPAFPGKIVLLDVAGTFPGGGAAGGDEDASGLRHYVVAALGSAGVEGPWSAQVAAGPP
ncbi:MAG TPA: hypothetical protein PKD59_11655 [Miltoncostaeaceae bacterium]|nr:hypothetical protein [Miltoncostaeaceae bacterium]